MTDNVAALNFSAMAPAHGPSSHAASSWRTDTSSMTASPELEASTARSRVDRSKTSSPGATGVRKAAGGASSGVTGGAATALTTLSCSARGGLLDAQATARVTAMIALETKIRGTRAASRATAAGSSAALAALAVVWAGLLSCTTTAGQQRTASQGSGEIRAALAPARAALASRGLLLAHPPRIVMHADADAFATATGQLDPSLRAWSTWDTVHLMPLSTWARHDEAALQQRMTHELCHIALYQRFGSEQRARAAKIPRFLQEGVCSVVAGQQRPDLRTTASLASPLAARAFVTDPELAYAAAHHAMAFLDRRLGPAWLQQVLARAVLDGDVARALLDVTGYDAVTLWRAVLTSAGDT